MSRKCSIAVFFGLARASMCALAALISVGCSLLSVVIVPASSSYQEADLTADIVSRPEKTGSITIPQAGDVLMVGGVTSPLKSTATAELFRVSTVKGKPTGQFLTTGSMVTARAALAAFELTTGPSAGSVVAAAGLTGTGKKTKTSITVTVGGLDSLELLAENTGTFAPSDATYDGPNGVGGPTVTELADHTFLIAGGISASGNPTSAAAIYDPSDGSVTPTSGTMS